MASAAALLLLGTRTEVAPLGVLNEYAGGVFTTLVVAVGAADEVSIGAAEKLEEGATEVTNLVADMVIRTVTYSTVHSSFVPALGW